METLSKGRYQTWENEASQSVVESWTSGMEEISLETSPLKSWSGAVNEHAFHHCLAGHVRWHEIAVGHHEILGEACGDQTVEESHSSRGERTRDLINAFLK